jgi:hypothetical protein
MEFGYFTLSDNHYENNSRSPNQFVADITDEALHADTARHAFRLDRRASFQFAGRALLPRSRAGLYRRAHEAYPACAGGHRAAAASSDPRRRAMGDARSSVERTRRFRRRPRLRRREYLPFDVSFEDNQGIFEEGLELVRELWAAEDRISHKGKHYSFDDVRITPKPVQKPIPTYVASFSKLSIELAARLGCNLIVAPFAAAMSFGGLKQVVDLYNETCVKHGQKPGRVMCSYFTHFADNPQQERAQRERQVRYYKECVIPAFPSDPKTAPPSYRYFIDMVERLQKVKPEDLTENSVLLGSAQQMTDTLKKAEAAGISEVILYVNVGLKPHAQVKDEMERFMREVAPSFEGKHKLRAA